MKWNSREPIWFDDKEYEQTVRNMTPDALWLRECLKYRAKVSSGCGIAFSGLLFLPTLGLSTVGLWTSGRTLDIARRKAKIIAKEIERRNLPHYSRKKRDVLIPLCISAGVIISIGVIDVLCLAGTSSSIMNAVAASHLDGFSAFAHDPGHFLSGAAHGVDFQVHQFFHLGGHSMAVSNSHLHSIASASSMAATVHDGPSQLAPAVLPPGHLDASLVSAAPSDNHAVVHRSAQFVSGLSVKGPVANAATHIHSHLAAVGGTHALSVQSADDTIKLVGWQSQFAPDLGTQLAGAATGMQIAQTMEQFPTKLLIANTGLESVWTSVMASSVQPRSVVVQLADNDCKDVEVESDHKNVEVESDHKNVEVESDHKSVEVESDHKNVEVESDHKNVEVEPDHKNVEVKSDHKNVEVEPDHKNFEFFEEESDDEEFYDSEAEVSQTETGDEGLTSPDIKAHGSDPEVSQDSKCSGSGSKVGEGSQDPKSEDVIANEFYAKVLTGEVPRFFVFLSKSGQQISQRIVTWKQACEHAKLESLGIKCNFCSKNISVQESSYYHCCKCSQTLETFSICEVCVAGRGCSCQDRHLHILLRKGKLGPDVDFGKLVGIRTKRKKRKQVKEVPVINVQAPAPLHAAASVEVIGTEGELVAGAAVTESLNL